VFEAYTRTQLSAFLRKGDILVMDNLGAHKCASTRKIISEPGGHIHWLPPYTPEANPIEMFWGWMKRRLRDAGARTRQALDEAIVSAVDALTPSIASAWTRNCGYRNLLG
jgi:transposase